MKQDAVRKTMKNFRNINLKNKIFFSILVVILVISAAIALLARWILVSTLISELELRGIAIARTIAGRSSGYILDKNYPELLNLIFDEAKLKERRYLVSYIFVSDPEEQVLSHTLTRVFPDSFYWFIKGYFLLVYIKPFILQCFGDIHSCYGTE